MTPLYLLSLTLLLASLGALRWRYGHNWLLRPYVLLAWCALIYHGLSEMIIRFSGAESLALYRVPRESVDRGALAASLGLVAMTLAYCVASKPTEFSTTASFDELRHDFDWRYLAIPAVPLLLYTYAGQGYITGSPLQGEGLSSEGFASQFLLPLMVMTSFGFLVRHPRQFAVIVAAQALMMAMAGQRLEVLIASVAVWLLARRIGIRPSRPQLVALALAGVMLTLSISSIRASSGRNVFYSDSGAASRVEALWEGIANPSIESVNGGGLVAEAALRLDSNTWAGAVSSAISSGWGPIGLRPLQMSLITAVPSVIFVDKVSSLDIMDRNVELAQIQQLGLPDIDYLPGHLTSFMGATGITGMIIMNSVVGLVLGVLDRIALGRKTPLRLLGLAYLALAALLFERGLDYYLIAARGYAVMAIAVGMAMWLRSAWPLSRVSASQDCRDRSSVLPRGGSAWRRGQTETGSS